MLKGKNSYRQWLRLIGAAILVCSLATTARAEGWGVNAEKEWRGRVASDLKKEAPARGYFANQAELARLWAAWRIAGPCPQLDFKSQMMLVATCNCSQISISPLQNIQGDLYIQVTVTKDIREDTAYVLALIPRRGVRTVNGKPVAGG